MSKIICTPESASEYNTVTVISTNRDDEAVRILWSGLAKDLKSADIAEYKDWLVVEVKRTTGTIKDMPIYNRPIIITVV